MLKVPSKTQIPIAELSQFMRIISTIDAHLTNGLPEQKNPKGEVLVQGITAEEYAEVLTPENTEILKKVIALVK